MVPLSSIGVIRCTHSFLCRPSLSCTGLSPSLARDSTTVQEKKKVDLLWGFSPKKKRGLVRGRSHLLPESRLISLPRGTEMFHFPRCLFCLSLCSWEIKTLSRCAKVLPFVLVYVPFLEDQGIPLVHPLSLRFHEYFFSGSSGGDRTHGPRSMNPMLVPLSYTAKVESPPSRSQSSGTANLQKKTGRKRIV